MITIKNPDRNIPLTNDVFKALQIADQIQGWLFDCEGIILFMLAQMCTGKGVITEIGAWKGKSTSWLANGSKAGKKITVYTIDTFEGSEEHQNQDSKIETFEEFKSNIEKANIDDIIIPIKSTSDNAVLTFTKPIEFLFIDGAHDYEQVKRDYQNWSPKIVEDGWIALHDTVGWPGPERVAEEFILHSKKWKNVSFSGSVLFAQKCLQNTEADRQKTRQVFVAKEAYKLFLETLREQKDESWLQKIQTKIGECLE